MFWEPLVTRWEKSVLVRAGVPRALRTQSRERAAAAPRPRGKSDGGDVEGSGRRRGAALPPHRRSEGRPGVPQHAARPLACREAAARSWRRAKSRSLRRPAKAAR